MVAQLDTDAAAIFMKIGSHAQESLESIVERKQKEEQDCGVFYWGYGGTICHPINQVLPFVREISKSSSRIPLLMNFTPSPFEGNSSKSTEYSVDNKTWQMLPLLANVTGSRFALVCKKLQIVEAKIDISQYAVGIGPSKGRPLSQYLSGRVDKACAIRQINQSEERLLKISFCADIVPPYAVLLR